MTLSKWQVTIKPNSVLTNKSEIVVQCMKSQKYLKQKGISGFSQTYIPIDLNTEAMIITTAEKSAASKFHSHREGSFRYIMSGAYKISYKENNKTKSVVLEKDDWIYIPRKVKYSSEVIKAVRIMHLYCVTNCE